MTQALVIILDRKEFEERLSAYYWAQLPHVQDGFVRAYGRVLPAGDSDRRQLISDVVTAMGDAELGALAQAVVMATGGPAA